MSACVSLRIQKRSLWSTMVVLGNGPMLTLFTIEGFCGSEIIVHSFRNLIQKLYVCFLSPYSLFLIILQTYLFRFLCNRLNIDWFDLFRNSVSVRSRVLLLSDSCLSARITNSKKILCTDDYLNTDTHCRNSMTVHSVLSKLASVLFIFLCLH